MVNKNSKKCASNNLPTRDMQNKMTLKFCLIPVRLIFTQKSRTKKDKRNISSCLFPHSTSKNGLVRSRNFPTAGDTPTTRITVFMRPSATLGEQPGCENLWLWSREVASFGKPRNCWEGLGKTVSFLDRMWGKRSPYSLLLRMSASKGTMEAGVEFMELLCDPDATLLGIYS